MYIFCMCVFVWFIYVLTCLFSARTYVLACYGLTHSRSRFFTCLFAYIVSVWLGTWLPCWLASWLADWMIDWGTDLLNYGLTQVFTCACLGCSCFRSFRRICARHFASPGRERVSLSRPERLSRDTSTRVTSTTYKIRSFVHKYIRDYSITHPLTHSPSPSPTHSHTLSLTPSLTHSLTH